MDAPNQYQLELYKLAVEMADRLSARRATANGYFLTVQSALIALLGVPGLSRPAVAGAGLVLAVAWWLLLRSYRHLSAAKFKVILTMEDRLPSRIYRDEWEELKRDATTPWRRYAELGLVERVVPAVFALIFVAVLVSAL
jgi:hypothetical protein